MVTIASPRVISPRSNDEPAQLSFSQERLWFLDQLLANDSVYNIAVATRLTGELDVLALRGALNELVRRHESLRTRFVSVEGVGRQLIDPPSGMALSMMDMTAQAAISLEEVLRAEATRA